MLVSDLSAGEKSAVTEGFETTAGTPDRAEPATEMAIVAVEEYKDLAKARKGLMLQAKTKMVRLHLCRHDEGQPCSIEDPFMEVFSKDVGDSGPTVRGNPGERR